MVVADSTKSSPDETDPAETTETSLTSASLSTLIERGNMEHAVRMLQTTPDLAASLTRDQVERIGWKGIISA